LLLFIRGNWHKPLPNEPLAPQGWEPVFNLITEGRKPEGLHCSIVLSYKDVGFEDFATDEMVEAASRFDLSKCMRLAMEKFIAAPEDVVELDALPAQVAAAAALSLHEVTLVKAEGDYATFSKPLRLKPLEVLKALYSGVELRLMPGPENWKLLKRAANVGLERLNPEDAAAILSGDEQRKAELVNLLKAEPMGTALKHA